MGNDHSCCAWYNIYMTARHWDLSSVLPLQRNHGLSVEKDTKKYIHNLDTKMTQCGTGSEMINK